MASMTISSPRPTAGKPANLIRYFLGFFYPAMSVINFYFGFTNIEIYRQWANSALLAPYTWFMRVVPAPLLAACIFLVAVFEVTIGIAYLFGRGKLVRLAMFAALAFHIFILPWGWWSMFNLLFIGLYALLLGKEYPQSLINKS